MSRVFAAVYYALQSARREPVSRVLDELDSSQWWSAETLKQRQFSRLDAVVRAALETRHYGEAWKGCIPGTGPVDPDEFCRLPLLEKSALRSDPGRLLNPRYRGPVSRFVTTGSSGVPLSVLRSRRSAAYGRACEIRALRWHGLDVGTSQVRFGGLSLESLGRLRARVIDGLMNRVRIGVDDLSDDRMGEILRSLQRIRPRLLYGYPSCLARFAAYVSREGGGPELGVRLVVSSSETLFPHRRETIVEAFRCPVMDEYGAAEVSVLAAECPDGGLHQTADSIYLEITDDDGTPLPRGEEGQVVVTDLHNLAAPLVRYRLGDRARFVTANCVCGRGLPCIEVVAGSSFGLLELPDGRVVSGAVMYFLAESLINDPGAGVAELVLVRRDLGFQVRFVRRPLRSPDLGELERRLREVLGRELPLTFAAVERIERRGGDKYRIILEEDA